MGQRRQLLLGGVSWDDVEGAIPQAGTRTGAALLLDILRLPDVDNPEVEARYWPGLVFSGLDTVTQSVALELLEEGWLEARHDGGVLEAVVHDASARLVPGWRFELCVSTGSGTGLSGLSVRSAKDRSEGLVLSQSEDVLFAALGEPSSSHGSVVVLVGPSGAGKTSRAEAMAGRAGRVILEPTVSALTDPRRSVSRNLWVMEQIIRVSEGLVLMENAERFFPRAFPAPAYCEAWYSFLEKSAAQCVLTTRWPDLLDQAVGDRADWVHALSLPRMNERRVLWERAVEGLSSSEAIDCDRLARRFRLNAGSIERSGRLAEREWAVTAKAVTQTSLEAAAALQVRHGLDKLAEKVITNLVLDDLVVTQGVWDQVQAVVDAARVREVVFDDWGFASKQPRGRGLSMLFDGEPGTGKTLCAEILAAELQLPLYRVSMGNILSKWVGETEKNLERIFAEARGSRTILLFDEADALFSKRVEVQQANDRFANLEVNALLQLMESHDGICVLTTNLKSGIDKAFERRLSFRIHFPFPDSETRARLWEHHLPEMAPVDDSVDVYALAGAFELSGGSIRNAAVRAAYRAAARGGEIGQADLAEGAKAECIAAGKLFRTLSEDE